MYQCSEVWGWVEWNTDAQRTTVVWRTRILQEELSCSLYLWITISLSSFNIIFWRKRADFRYHKAEFIRPDKIPWGKTFSTYLKCVNQLIYLFAKGREEKMHAGKLLGVGSSVQTLLSFSFFHIPTFAESLSSSFLSFPLPSLCPSSHLLPTFPVQMVGTVQTKLKRRKEASLDPRFLRQQVWLKQKDEVGR